MESLNFLRYLLLLERESRVRFSQSNSAFYQDVILILGLIYYFIIFRLEYGQTCVTLQTVTQSYYECV